MIKHERRSRKSYVAKPRPTYDTESYEPDEFPATQYTQAEQAVIAELAKQGVEYITQIPFARKDDQTRKGEPKQYIIDILIKNTKIILEVEGSKSSSSDNPDRDKYFKEKGYQIIHIPNELALKHSFVLVGLIKAFTYKSFL